ncbi:hypothetical protein EF913_28310 [Streptomyces sp. WAC04189]|uniref:hypothetical protein n=1 Tax=Streptomyces sp. WAC04189 TaxID=2487411 RepID=UPI000F9BA323|nr:hypothetical protein [Streptomyces sp. WAC04189]RSR98036.1 hypothetical protein EF913_28310 [Streptomyces sp. WAC04189]
MSDQPATPWTRQQWDQYLEETRDNIDYPDIDPCVPLRLTAPLITYVCPFCLRTQPSMDLVLPENTGTFTATWRDCGHRVSVPLAETIPPPSHPAFGTVRFHCPRCSWTHDERPGSDPTPPLRLPAHAAGDTLTEVLDSVTTQDISTAISAAAAERARTSQDRIEKAFANHYAMTHPDVPAPTRPTP